MREQLERLLAEFAAEHHIESREALPYALADLRHLAEKYNWEFAVADHIGFQKYRAEAQSGSGDGKAERLNQTVKPTIPPGYLLAAVTYGAGKDADRAVFLAFHETERIWVVGEWNADHAQAFYKGRSEFTNNRVFLSSEAGLGEAYMDFVTRSSGLLRGYIA